MQALQIIRIIQETATAKTFVLKPEGNESMDYKAGQFLTLVFNTRFGEKRRSYSMSSSPALHEPLSITIKRVENGEFSRLLVGHAKQGDTLISSGVSGFFVLPEKDDAIQQYFFLAAGSGITPCFSLIKTLLATTLKQVVLVYSNRDKSDTIFYKELVELQQQYADRFQLRFLFSNNFDVYNGRLSNWLLQQLLKQYMIATVADTLFYMCGPFEYMQMINITLLNEGIPPGNIKKENFSTLPRLVKPVPPDTAVHTVTVHWNNQVSEIKVQYPNSILAVAKLAGIDIPFSCEAGRCGSCVATCTKGKIWMAYNEVLMDDEIAKGRILCCQAYPLEGDAAIVI